MSKYETVKRYYDKGYWTLQMVRNAVAKGRITPEQFAEITGEAYTNE